MSTTDDNENISHTGNEYVIFDINGSILETSDLTCTPIIQELLRRIESLEKRVPKPYIKPDITDHEPNNPHEFIILE